MVDIVNLTNDLSTCGNVDIIGLNNQESYIVVMSGVTSDLQSINSIQDSYLSVDFPNIVSETLVEGVYKLERTS
jgi:hypothetical protein